MSEQQKSNEYIYKERFAGVSFAQNSPTQSLYLFSTEGSTGSASISIPASEVTAFRAAFSGFLAVIEPGFGFKDSVNPANKFELNPNAVNRAQEREQLHRKVQKHNFKEREREKEEKGAYIPNKVWLSLDPVVTITAEGILFEVVDKRGFQLAAYMLKSSGYTGSTENGFGRVEAGADLFETVSTLNGQSDLQIHIGKDLDCNENYKGAIEKTFAVPKAWQRMSLQLMASSMLPATSFSMTSIDLYNIVRAFHLRAGDKKMRILLVDGQQPRISIDPWDWNLVATGDSFSGKTQQIELIEYKAIRRFQDVCPFVTDVSLRLTGEAQPAFWTLTGSNFTLVLGLSNFKPNNWTKGLMLNQSLPRESADVADLGSVVSISSENKGALTHGIQMGAYSIRIADTSVRRDFLAGLDLNALIYRNGQERVAYDLVNEGRVQIQSTVEPNGRRVLMTAEPQRFTYKGDVVALQKEINKRPNRNYSTVTEAQKDFQFTEPVFQPRLAILSNGATRLPECSSTYFRKYGDKRPSAHIQALYIQYLENVKNESPEQAELRDQLLFKVSDTGSEEVHKVRLQSKRVIEDWGSFVELNNKTCRRQVLAFNDVSEARDFFHNRVRDLEQQGFVNAG